MLMILSLVQSLKLMGRRKQSRPQRSGGLIIQTNDSTTPITGSSGPELKAAENLKSFDVSTPDYYVQLHSSCHWRSDFDISEVILTDLNITPSYTDLTIDEGFFQQSSYSLRFRVCNIDSYVFDRIKLGHWPVLSSNNISLEFVHTCTVQNEEIQAVMLSGRFDGSDEGITSLVHLTSMEFMTLRPVLGVLFSPGTVSLRMRVEILKSVFDSCGSLLENTRQVWKKSMMNVMAWLRPEVMTLEARYGINTSTDMEVDSIEGGKEDTSNSMKSVKFDVARFYEAIKPSKSDPLLEDELPDLLPVLRPYQRRAVYWMVEREKGEPDSSWERKKSQVFSPLCIAVSFLDTSSKMYYNPFSGTVSLHPELSSAYVFGGILADEMGLGKTVELLACIFAHRKLSSDGGVLADMIRRDPEDQEVNIKRLKRERVECTCGAVTESYKYKGLWVQCDICDAWQHADCVGYSPRGKKKRSAVELKKHRKKTSITLVERDGEYICEMCSELVQATETPIATGATLIVCPAPILPQWHVEIERHTRPGSLKTCIYEGVRDTSLSNTSAVDISELASADIVLTTYDVLKEDLSHDSDRHEGDRRFLRFQKRYPVIPTFLTRIYWWRICLDEAQMVETNSAAATEMALRLSAKYRWCITGTPIQRKLDDLYGLLRFLKASPFDVSRWWIDVIRDPYERRYVGAMELTHTFFKRIMWRSSKKEVADELEIPPQEECVSWLTFSAIEEHFYQRQHETCVSYAREVIESLKDDVLKRKVPGSVSSDVLACHLITPNEAAKLLNSLLKLRQACCHPQVGSSGLRSVQQSPMTMEEILMVLVGKTKVEGEEALRKLVVALNALAGISIIKQNFSEAVLLYQEALALTAEHAEDFRLDPLLNIHIHHNLSELLPMTVECSSQLSPNGHDFHGSTEKILNSPSLESGHTSEMQKFRGGDIVDSPTDGKEQCLDIDQDSDASRSSSISYLKSACDNLKQKYLSVFITKHSIVQDEFRKSYMQVSDALSDKKDQYMGWWLDALHHAELNNDFSKELIRKTEEAVSGNVNNSRSSKIISHFRSITALKYHIQTRLEQLETSRKRLVDQLLDIDQTMQKPKEEDIERVRYCRICQSGGDGPTCLHCELEELFKDYEARLFRLKKSHGGLISSAEEAVDLQKKNSALNRFYWNLSELQKIPSSVGDINDESRKRSVRDTVVASKLPSELEVILGVVKNHCKANLGLEGMMAARKQLHILEAMRKEYGHARSLAIAQAQLLFAHDEIRMATSRLHLRESQDDKSLDALGVDELESASVIHSNEKFMSLALLSRIKGKLRYLKGLVLSKQKLQSESPNNSSLTQEMVASTMSNKNYDCLATKDDEACPVCQEKLNSQKMVFQCGHFTCCKCLFAMTEHKLLDHKSQPKWIMCPTCRQHTDYGNIAYADDRQVKSSMANVFYAVEDCEKHEASLTVQGSYGTKIEAITRRILSIKFSDPNAKVLVFSSWNDVLDVLEHAFRANDITYIRMKGGRKAHAAISEFREKNSAKRTCKTSTPLERRRVQVLLLLVQHGANGLNLLEAQHVVLVEPLLNPAAEAQAISRVHRIGQEKKTLVHRFIVKNTVEESIYKMNRSRNSSAFISGNTKNQDQPVLTLKDIESLFATVSSIDEEPPASLRHLPPSMAAAIAAERRLGGNTAA
ncbi:hypothetical protein K2173_023492 [Erythroxylum novogranatense]|uniref:E3 ubiquitin-protein ligase SHPRH n=1 Tax=Erythroxylum novogranatense TaxID=1862640 RepID=A0AAV8TW80_9ROSI|nr:hypothetical protein K2173_023492 [Erythroxylum novogranatense]